MLHLLTVVDKLVAFYLNCSSAALDNAVPLQLMMMLLVPLGLLHLFLLPWVQIWVVESLQPQIMLQGPLQYQSILLVQYLQPVKVNIRTLKCYDICWNQSSCSSGCH